MADQMQGIDPRLIGLSSWPPAPEDLNALMGIALGVGALPGAGRALAGARPPSVPGPMAPYSHRGPVDAPMPVPGGQAPLALPRPVVEGSSRRVAEGTGVGIRGRVDDLLGRTAPQGRGSTQSGAQRQRGGGARGRDDPLALPRQPHGPQPPMGPPRPGPRGNTSSPSPWLWGALAALGPIEYLRQRSKENPDFEGIDLPLPPTGGVSVGDFFDDGSPASRYHGPAAIPSFGLGAGSLPGVDGERLMTALAEQRPEEFNREEGQMVRDAWLSALAQSYRPGMGVGDALLSAGLAGLGGQVHGREAYAEAQAEHAAAQRQYERDMALQQYQLEEAAWNRERQAAQLQQGETQLGLTARGQDLQMQRAAMQAEEQRRLAQMQMRFMANQPVPPAHVNAYVRDIAPEVYMQAQNAAFEQMRNIPREAVTPELLDALTHQALGGMVPNLPDIRGNLQQQQLLQGLWR